MLKGLNNNNNNSFSMESLLAENVGGATTADDDGGGGADDVLVRCLKNSNRVCSNCGRLDCNNVLQCCNSRGGGGEGGVGIIKDNKPVLKFSVSAILGNEQPTSRSVQSGEYIGAKRRLHKLEKQLCAFLKCLCQKKKALLILFTNQRTLANDFLSQFTQ